MVWDADGRTKERDNNMRDRRSVGGVCDVICCRSTSTYTVHLSDTVHLERCVGGRSILFEDDDGAE